ncbi:beta-glucosidase [Nocardioides gansuensis]|uniref:Exo-alpha-(1->6)-L-arabinopyranosidase n=1 Tax=Nocardioides gansuensis TaxID=2138300 RepID=A0A2T8FEC5_9ACTN|nr:beta-glucosidase [Nocardioides gansuensis]
MTTPAPATALPVVASQLDALPFRNPDLPVEQRVADLLGRLTLDEKLSLLHQSQAAIPRLDIPYFKAGTEALHGVAWSNDIDDGWKQVLADRATVFPQAVGLASTWDPALVRRVGSAVGDEARAYNTLNPRQWGLQVWAPVVNLLRDPRWGRNEEGYSEDPLLTSEIATAYGKGLSGDDPTYLKTAPVLKHFYAYNNETNRSASSSNLRQQLRHEYEYAAFRPAIEAGAATGVMASYNKVNGRPTHVDRALNEDVRSWTDETLYNMSDAWGPHAVTQAQHFYDDETVAYAHVLKAGLDAFVVDDSNSKPMIATLKDALARGLITEADVDRAVTHALTIRCRLGHFDPDGGPYAGASPDVLDSPAHRRLNRKTAEEALVLLRNDDDLLPLDPKQTTKVAVVGPLADSLFSDWYGGKLPYEVTPLDGIRERLGKDAVVTSVEGLDRVALRDTTTGRYLSATGTTSADRVVGTEGEPGEAAQWDVNEWMADVATLRNAGNGRYLTGNFGPFNTSATIPTGWYVQQQFRFEEQPDGTVLLQYIGYETNEPWWWIPGHYVTVAPDGTVGTGTKEQAARFDREVLRDGAAEAAAAAAEADAVVAVVGSNPFVYGREVHDRASTALGGSQQDLLEAVQQANPRAAVVLESSYPVTMDVDPGALLWTTHAGSETGNAVAATLFGDSNPSGRLTQTWYRSDADLPEDVFDYDIVKTGQTYLYFEGEPGYPFGHGLSYTDFRYSDLRVDSKRVGQDGRITVTVDVTNTGSRAGAEVVQLYSHQRTSRATQPLQELEDFRRVTLAPGRTVTVRFRVNADQLAHWDVTRERWVVERSTYDLMVGSSAEDIRQTTAVDVAGEVIPPRNLALETVAENFDDYDGALLVPTTKERGTSVAAGDRQAWVKFAASGLDRPTGFTASVAKATQGAGTLEVRLDSPTGPLLATAPVSTGGEYDYTEVSVDTLLDDVSGLRDVYLVLSPGVRVATFSLS